MRLASVGVGVRARRAAEPSEPESEEATEPAHHEHSHAEHHEHSHTEHHPGHDYNHMKEKFMNELGHLPIPVWAVAAIVVVVLVLVACFIFCLFKKCFAKKKKPKKVRERKAGRRKKEKEGEGEAGEKEGEVKKEGEEEEKEQEKLGKLEFSLDYNFTDAQVGQSGVRLGLSFFRSHCRMSGGRASEGAGCITWWGFSPARDLLSTGPVRRESNVNILLVGSGDPRHILKTISSLRDEESLHVWVIENSMELVARQLLLLYLALMPKESMGTNEKTEVFLEVFGNGEIRSQTEETLRHAASQLSLAVTETLETATHPCLNTTLLKFKERDELARIFKLWIQPRPSSSSSTCAAPILMSKVWDCRVRQHLGTCYDCKKERFDWDLIMKLHEKGCGVINKQQYARWRERGLAFEMREGAYQITNQSLLSSRVFSQRGDKVAVRGYWGDIVSSPYLSFGIKTDDKSLLKTQNGQHIKTAQDISIANVQELFQSLSSRRGCPTTSQSAAETGEPSPSPEADPKSATINDLMHLSGVSVTLLPMDSLNKLPEKQRYSHFFNTVYFSASCAHQLGPTMRQIAAPDAVLVVELAKYILDLNKEQEAGFAKKVASMALEAGFEPWREGQSDDVHAVFIPQRK